MFRYCRSISGSRVEARGEAATMVVRCLCSPMEVMLPREINWCRSATSTVMNGSVAVVASLRRGVVVVAWFILVVDLELS